MISSLHTLHSLLTSTCDRTSDVNNFLKNKHKEKCVRFQFVRGFRDLNRRKLDSSHPIFLILSYFFINRSSLCRSISVCQYDSYMNLNLMIMSFWNNWLVTLPITKQHIVVTFFLNEAIFDFHYLLQHESCFCFDRPYRIILFAR